MASTTTTGQARDPFIYIQFKDTLQTQPASLVERYIKRYGIDVNRVFADGDTPAHVAAERGEDSILKVLGKHGVRIDKEGKDGLSPMQRAALRGQERAVRELCRLGEDVAHRCKPDQYSPLMYALGAMHGSCAEALLSLGAASIEKSEGYTARAIAILTGFHEMITKLDLEDFSNEFVFRKVIGHFCALKDKSSLDGETFTFSGAYAPYMHDCIAESLSEFFGCNHSIFSRYEKKSLLDAFQSCSRIRTANDAFQELQLGKPVILRMGWHRHAIDLVIVGSYLFVCNGGEGVPVGENTIAAFKIDRAKITKKKLKNLFHFFYARHPMEKGRDFFYRTLPKMLAPGDGKTVVKDDVCKLIETISPKTIKVGICSLACGKIAFRVLGAMLKLERADRKHWKGIAKQVKREGKQWSLFARMFFLEKYLNKHRVYHRLSAESTQQTDIEMVKSAWKKIQAYMDKHLRFMQYDHFMRAERLQKIVIK